MPLFRDEIRWDFLGGAELGATVIKKSAVNSKFAFFTGSPKIAVLAESMAISEVSSDCNKRRTLVVSVGNAKFTFEDARRMRS